MATTRLLALSALFLALPACDSKLPGDHGSQQPNFDPADDFGREGASCDLKEAAGECQTEGIRGREFCVVNEEYSQVWSACLTETCEDEGDSRPCEGESEGEDELVQHCVRYDAERGRIEKRWSACTEPHECEPGETMSCGLDEGIDMGCRLNQDGRYVWITEDCNTPLVLSFGAAIEFSPAPVAAADFDIRGGLGSCARADWPSPATPWLALDRDGNGRIDGGHELFGSATRMSSGTGPHNGFQALAELDSDRDGKLTGADARWGELVLWADHDADRRSNGWETLPLASFEIVAIDLGYTSRRECDVRGNCGIERASFVYRSMGRQHAGEVVDVRVRCE